jgi:glycosyltransferase involved in cell wall biosynthesis
MVLNVFDTTYAAFPQSFDWKFRFYARTFIPSGIRRASAILTLSEHARGEIMRIYDLPGERVHVVPPGVGDEFHPLHDPDALARVRAKYNLPEKYLLYVGGCHPRKNVPVLIAAFARARQEIPDLHFVLAGPRFEPGVIDAPVAASGASNAIHHLDFVPEADLRVLFAAARVLVFASRLEGFGMPPVEAMACGTPVVAAPNPPMPEVLGDAAWFTADDSVEAMTEGILRVLRDDALQASLRERGIARARLYSWQDSARKTIDIYDAVLGQARGAG